MKRPSTFGMSIQQIRELFHVGREPPGHAQGCDDEAKRKLLDRRLAQSLPRDKTSNPPSPEGPSPATAQPGGEAIGEILRNPSSEVETVRRIKRHAKRWATRAASGDEHDTAAAIYYAAIAHALVFQDQRITQFPLPTLAETYARLSEEHWVPKELVALFQQAQACCLKNAASG